jgi:hypothetical protein
VQDPRACDHGHPAGGVEKDSLSDSRTPREKQRIPVVRRPADEALQQPQLRGPAEELQHLFTFGYVHVFHRMSPRLGTGCRTDGE